MIPYASGIGHRASEDGYWDRGTGDLDRVQGTCDEALVTRRLWRSACDEAPV